MILRCFEQVHLLPTGDVTVGGDRVSTHVGVDVLEGPNAMVIIAQIDLGMAGDVAFDTARPVLIRTSTAM